MSEGRHELEQAIAVWEKRHAEAVRLKREAEVVMPFLRAAVEELDTFRSSAADETAPEPAVAPASPAVAPNPFDGNFPATPPASVDSTTSKAAEQDQSLAESADDSVSDFPSFQPRAISALMDDEDDDEAAVG